MQLSVVLVLSLASPALRADVPSPLSRLPADAALVVQLRGVERVKERALSLFENALPAHPISAKMVGEAKKAVNDALGGKFTPGRTLAGLHTDGPVFLALTEIPDGPNALFDAVVVVARVSKYAEFRDGLLTKEERKDLDKRPGYEMAEVNRRAVYFAEKDGYAIVTARRDLAVKFSRGAGAGMEKKLDADAAKELVDADLAVYLDTMAFGKAHGKLLALSAERTEERMFAPGSPFAASADMKPLFKEFFRAMKQFCVDSRALLVTARAEKLGLKLHARVQVGAATRSGKLLAEEVPGPLTEAGALPSNLASFTVSMPPRGKEWGTLMRALVAAAAGRRGLKEAAELEREAGVTLTLHAARDRLGSEGVTVSSAKSPDKLVKSHLVMMRGLRKGDPHGHLVVAEKADVTENAQEHRGFQLHRARLTIDLAGSGRMNHVTAAFMRQQLGGDETSLWFGTDGKVFVEARGRTWGAAKRNLDAYLDRGDDTLGKAAGFRAFRKRLPKDITGLFVEETTVFSQLVHDQQAATMRVPRREIKRAKVGEASYWGWAMTLQKGQVGLDVWVPAKVFRDSMAAVFPRE